MVIRSGYIRPHTLLQRIEITHIVLTLKIITVTKLTKMMIGKIKIMMNEIGLKGQAEGVKCRYRDPI